MNFQNVNFTLDKPLFVRRLLDYIGLEHFLSQTISDDDLFSSMLHLVQRAQ